jgi:hypothetical protein
MRVDVSNSQVGIGTTNPTQLLDVRGGNLRVFEDLSHSHIFLGEESDNNKSGMIKYYQGTGTVAGNVPGKMIFGHFGNTSGGNDLGICLEYGGNVGINTNDPSAPLDVSGNAKITGTLSCNGDATIGNATTDSHTLNGNATITGTLSCDGDATIGNATTDSHTLNGNATITGTLSCDGDATIGNANTDSHTLNGNANITGTFSCDGDATIGNANTDSHTLNGNANITGTLSCNGNATIGNADTDSHTLNGTAKISGSVLSKAILRLGTYSSSEDSDRYMIEINGSDSGISKYIAYRAHTHEFRTWDNSFVIMSIKDNENGVNGRMGINTHNPTQTLDVNGGNLRVFDNDTTTHIFLGKNTTLSDKSGMIKYFQGNGSGTGKMHIGHIGDLSGGIDQGLYVKKGGNVGINTDNPTYTLDVTGNARFTQGIDADYFFATSDYRVKEKVQTISGDLYTVDHLRPVSYVLKHSQQPHIGFIAHELQEHFPTAVSGEKDGEKMQSVNYSELVPVLVKEVQELKITCQNLQRANAQLQQDMVELKAMVLQIQ